MEGCTPHQGGCGFAAKEGRRRARRRKTNGAEQSAPFFWGMMRVELSSRDHIAAISASPNCEHFTSLAPSIMRAKS